MKILKEPAIWKKEKKCTGKGYGSRGCGALLEIETDDIYLDFERKSYWSIADEEFCSYLAHSYKFQCPCCKNETHIDEKEIPENVRNIVLNSSKAKRAKTKYLKKHR